MLLLPRLAFAFVITETALAASSRCGIGAATPILGSPQSTKRTTQKSVHENSVVYQILLQENKNDIGPRGVWLGSLPLNASRSIPKAVKASDSVSSDTPTALDAANFKWAGRISKPTFLYPVWSPDGRYLAACELDDHWRNQRLLIIDATTNTVARRFPLAPENWNVSSYGWSPNGSDFAYTDLSSIHVARVADFSIRNPEVKFPVPATVEERAKGLDAYRVDSPAAPRLLYSNTGVFHLTWSPDSRRLAFFRWIPGSKTNICELQTVRASDGSGAIALATSKDPKQLRWAAGPHEGTLLFTPGHEGATMDTVYGDGSQSGDASNQQPAVGVGGALVRGIGGVPFAKSLPGGIWEMSPDGAWVVMAHPVPDTPEEAAENRSKPYKPGGYHPKVEVGLISIQEKPYYKRLAVVKQVYGGYDPPTWSPDSKWLAQMSDTGQSFTIINATTGDKQKFTPPDNMATYPVTWRPFVHATKNGENE